MKFPIRRQLLILSLGLLGIPWAGYQLILQLEQALRQQHQDNLLTVAKVAANQLGTAPAAESLGKLATDGHYAHPLRRPIVLDGYDDDWIDQNIPSLTVRSPIAEDNRYLNFRTGNDGTSLLILITVHGTAMVLRGGPGDARHDQLILRLGDRLGMKMSVFAPGAINIQPLQRRAVTAARQIRGNWQDLGDGYSIELEVPLSLTEDGLYLTLTDHTPGKDVASFNIIGSQGLPSAILYPQPVLSHSLDQLTLPHIRLFLVNRNAWILANSKPLPDRPDASENGLLLRLLYSTLQWVMARETAAGNPDNPAGKRLDPAVQSALQGKPASQWHTDSRTGRATVMAAYPVSADYAVIAESTAGAIASVTNRALGNVLAISLIVMAALMLGLLLFATLLSVRITRLRRNVEKAVQQDGRLGEAFSPGVIPDELGELSQSYAAMLRSVRGYHQYLEGFAGKVSHELKTPLAIISSSLEILASGANEKDRPFIERAQTGAHRLGLIIRNMSEATRLEKTIQQTPPDWFAPAAVIQSLGESYRALLTTQRLEINIVDTHKQVMGSAELLQQLIDKLFENARDFTPADGTIEIHLAESKHSLILDIINSGSSLPKAMEQEIFGAFVSIRKDTTGTGNLGQGLVIAKLIADYHQGKLTATNLAGGQGVRFRLILPAKD